MPNAAVQDSHYVNHNDIVVMGSDGVFDNLYDTDIISQCIQPKINLVSGNIDDIQDTATCISTLAEVTSYKKDFESPFTKSARRHNKTEEQIQEKYLGGKEDDITVIVAQVKLHD